MTDKKQYIGWAWKAEDGKVEYTGDVHGPSGSFRVNIRGNDFDGVASQIGFPADGLRDAVEKSAGKAQKPEPAPEPKAAKQEPKAAKPKPGK